ncbi:hypothetical protein IKU74_01340 [bacterium]|nr:hypothetical protein [bacterium]
MNNIFIASKLEYNIHFGARAKVIRDADKICRAVNTRFPHISPTYRSREVASNILGLIDESNNSFQNSTTKAKEKYDDYFKKVGAYVTVNTKLEASREKRIINNGVVDYFSKLIVALRRDQLANCAELSEIALLMCKNKKFDDVRIFSLEAFEKFDSKNQCHKNLAKSGCDIENVSAIDLDHVAVSFQHGGKTIVVDPWLGIADFADNYKTIIKTLYKNFFIDLKDSHSLRFKFDNDDSVVSGKAVAKLAKKFKSLNVSLE